MPLNVRRFCTFLFLALAGSTGIATAQAVAQSPPQTTTAVPQGPTSGDVMRGRISKAKAFIVVRNYNAAIYELENVRKETSDEAVRSAVNVLLMNSYLEQGDYKRAQDLLTEFYNLQKTTKPMALASYMAVAGQVVKGARDRVERYKALGLTVSDRMLPLEALNDLEKMRETLELVVTQSKAIGQTAEKSGDAMALLEEATTSRGMLGRDDYDSRRWKDVVADTREQMASSRSVVLSAVDDPAAAAAVKSSVPPQPIENKRVETETKPVETDSGAAAVKPLGLPASSETPPVTDKSNAVRDREVVAETNIPGQAGASQVERPVVYVPSAPPSTTNQSGKVDAPKDEDVKVESSAATKPEGAAAPAGEPASPINVGSLLAYATRQSQPVYPLAAKTMRTTGVVTVEVVVDEKGEVATVRKVSGPMMLQDAAKDAIRKWKFKPFVRDGQPVKANGFVNFSFSI